MKNKERESLKNSLMTKYGITAGRIEEDILEGAIGKYTLGNPDTIRVFFGVDNSNSEALERAIMKDFHNQKEKFEKMLERLGCTEEEYVKAGNRWYREY